ncbi:MAG: hypothetical protein LBH43_15700 [Treponema sp.]|jgi:hypothetical protein|nr:hypothetical protein [Treponema sp.]
MKISKETLRSPYTIFVLYMLAASLVIMTFRFIFPGSDPPLLFFSRNWRLVRGLSDLLDLFPALAFSALVIPFGLVSIEEDNLSFSKIFFRRLLVSVVTAISAAVVYGVIFFLALPLVKDYEGNLHFKGEVYRSAKERMRIHAEAREWNEASRLFRICDSVWPDSPELASYKNEIEINIDKLFYLESEERAEARAALAMERQNMDIGVSGETQLVDAAQAIILAEEAFNEHRFYDAHWLATLGERLAIRGSPEAATAARLAGRAWNRIESQAPNLLEEHLYSLYALKRLGYLAMNTGEWIRAYYIFLELTDLTPDDPDAANFLAVCEQETQKTAFFVDEMELSMGEVLTGAVFSLPGQEGRVVLRFSSLSATQDYAYGMGLEYMSFDEQSRPVTSLQSPYAKLLPLTLDEKPRVLILTHALDRYDKNLSWGSEWFLGRKTEAGIILEISFEEFLLLSQVRRGLSNLSISELFSASAATGNAGYISRIFEAEILNRLGSVLFFLPMAIIVIVIGWCLRTQMRPRYLFIPSFLILPVVFHSFVFLYRAVLNTLGIWLVLRLGFTTALTVFIVTLVVSFFISLIVLAAQHN